jgi:hypothetical protein
VFADYFDYLGLVLVNLDGTRTPRSTGPDLEVLGRIADAKGAVPEMGTAP